MKRVHSAISVTVFFALALAGCRLNPESRGYLASAAAAAQERAAFFAGFSKIVGAKNAAEEADVQRMVAAHTAGLALDASALVKLVNAVQASGNLGNEGKQAVRKIAAAAKARAQNWEAIIPHTQARGLDPKEWDAIAQAHLLALALCAKSYADLAASFDPPKNKE